MFQSTQCPRPEKNPIFSPRVRLRRGAAALLVGGLHVLAALIILAGKTPRPPREPVEVPISFSLYFPRAQVPGPAAASRPSASVRGVVSPRPETSITHPSISEPARSVDWAAEARQVAAGIAARRSPPNAPGATDPIGSAPAAEAVHHAGEQYTLAGGEKILWLSERCYMISDPPDLATPNAFAHFAQSRTTCRDAAPRGDLFRKSVAYRNFHPDP